MALWVIYSIASAVFASTMMLIQEKNKVSGFTLAFWNKVVAAIAVAPLLLTFEMPSSPEFYAILLVSAAIWAVSDIIYFNNISDSGAGTVSRVLPIGLILTFLLWLPFDPYLVTKYIANPWVTAGIISAIVLAAFFGFKMVRCSISAKAIRALWFVIFAGLVSPVLNKLMTEYGDTAAKSAIGFVFFEALAMIAYLGFYALFIKRSVPKDFFDKRVSRPIIKFSILCTLMVLSTIAAVFYAPNPAYVSIIGLSNTVLILVYYRFRKIKEESNVWAGMGLVASAALLILFESFMPN